MTSAFIAPTLLFMTEPRVRDGVSDQPTVTVQRYGHAAIESNSSHGDGIGYTHVDQYLL